MRSTQSPRSSTSCNARKGDIAPFPIGADHLDAQRCAAQCRHCFRFKVKRGARPLWGHIGPPEGKHEIMCVPTPTAHTNCTRKVAAKLHRGRDVGRAKYSHDGGGALGRGTHPRRAQQTSSRRNRGGGGEGRGAPAPPPCRNMWAAARGAGWRQTAQ